MLLQAIFYGHLVQTMHTEDEPTHNVAWSSIRRGACLPFCKHCGNISRILVHSAHRGLALARPVRPGPAPLPCTFNVVVFSKCTMLLTLVFTEYPEAFIFCNIWLLSCLGPTETHDRVLFCKTFAKNSVWWYNTKGFLPSYSCWWWKKTSLLLYSQGMCEILLTGICDIYITYTGSLFQLETCISDTCWPC